MGIRTQNLIVGTVLVAALLAACSSPVFDPVGNFLGLASFSPNTITMKIASPSGGTYAFTLDDGASPTATGACTHDATRNPNDLTCTYILSTSAATLAGAVEDGVFSGTWTIVDSSSVLQTGTFKLTKP